MGVSRLDPEDLARARSSRVFSEIRSALDLGEHRRPTERREFADAQAVAALEDAHQLVEAVSCFRVYARMTRILAAHVLLAVDGLRLP